MCAFAVADRSWLVVGAGYTGARVVARLAEAGAAVTATRRRWPGGAALGGARLVDLNLDLDLDALPPEVDAAGGVVVVCAPPGDPAGAREAALVRALRRCARLVYVSSTGVYGPGGGQWVDEAWPTTPSGPLGRARLVAERALAQACAEASLPWCALRAAGIYGPGRGLAARVRSGAARVIDDGAAHTSRIHVDDLVSAILAAGVCRATGFINCADDDPAPHGEVYDEIARTLGLPPPSRVAAAALSDDARAMLLADRKITNRRLREELGVTLAYPTWRHALAAELPPGPT